jgi:protocatechuate 3,4-dioxygenase beta subunit
MRGDYPDPFAGGAGTACGLTTAMILGPCYASTLEREDISDGEPGLPVRLSFLVVRGDGCTPIAGATVDIWHAAPRGVYSSFPATTICNPGEEALESESFCRGVQTTDANGRVDFSTVFPGWYGGRAIHIHFTVRIDGNHYVTSQLFFEDSLNDEVLAQIDYASRGPRDTRNDADVFLPSDMAPFLLSTAKRSDGTLHVWKLLVVRSSLDEPLPTAPTDLPPLPPASPDGGVTP